MYCRLVTKKKKEKEERKTKGQTIFMGNWN